MMPRRAGVLAAVAPAREPCTPVAPVESPFAAEQPTGVEQRIGAAAWRIAEHLLRAASRSVSALPPPEQQPMAHTVTVYRPADIIRIRRATDANLRLSVTRRSLPDAQASLTARQQSSKRTQRLGHAPRKRIVDRREVALIM
jgi:hypothetical protein